MPEDPLTPTAVWAGLRTAALPRTIHCYGQVGSTMDLARELLRSATDRELPLLVTAEEQTAGRGRMGRPWVAPAGSALLLSLALRPGWLPPGQAVTLVWMAAVALCEAVEQAAGVPARLKWPNDLLIQEAGGRRQEAGAGGAAHNPLPITHSLDWKKAAGILLEVSYGGARVTTAIVGCGVNVSAAPPKGSTRYPASCIAAAASAPVARLGLLQTLLERMDDWHTRLQRGEGAALGAAWRDRLHTLGRPARVDTPAGPLEGIAEDVDGDGALLLRDAAGALHRISAGDVGVV